MSPEHGPGPEEQEFKAGSEEVEAERDAREEGKAERIAELEVKLEAVDDTIDEIKRNNQPGRDEAILHWDDRRRELERRLDELEGDG